MTWASEEPSSQDHDRAWLNWEELWLWGLSKAYVEANF